MSRPATADHAHFLRRSALASICLVLVAGLHAYRVWTVRQTPWKGGGFGMFSTVDAESARFLRVTLTLDGVEQPVRVPESLAKRQAVLRAAPTEAGARELADKLLRLQWRRRSEYWSAVAERVESQKSLAADALRPPLSVAAELPRGQASDWEPVAGAEAGVSPTAVRIEILRHRFDPSSSTLRAEPMLSVTQPEARP